MLALKNFLSNYVHNAYSGDHGKVPVIASWENGFICKCLDLYLVRNGLICCVWTHIFGKWTCIVWYLNLYFVEINLYWVFELILC